MPESNIRILFIALLCISCTSDHGPLTTLFSFPEKLSEVSAIETTNRKSLWALQDSGNTPEVYSLDLKGNIAHTLALDSPNQDWEGLASDSQGNLYIGDFGNNDNARKDLCIYKIDSADLTKNRASASQKTGFYYPEQTAFPPKKSNQIFDAEAFFTYQGHFYIFTKNRSSKFDGTTTLYKVPNTNGRHAAQKLGSFAACNTYKKCAVTAADISPDGKTVALLTATKVYLFTNFKSDDFFSGDVQEIDLGTFTQKEGLCFVSGSELYIADEKDKKTGGKLYRLAIGN